MAEKTLNGQVLYLKKKKKKQLKTAKTCVYIYVHIVM